MTQAVIQYLGKDWIDYKEVFFTNLRSGIPLLNKINEYLFSTSGKCLRPMLCLLSSHACSVGAAESHVVGTGAGEHARDCRAAKSSVLCAAAAEMIHTATLLHDDVADNAPMRRGKPNIMSLFSPAASVLVGDYWLASAIRTILDNCDTRIFRRYGECIEDLAKGEMLQMQKAETMDMTMDDYLSIIDCKTASLFRSAMVGGAYSVNAPEVYIDAMDGYALHLGRAFQMEDDILDYSPHLDTGKTAGNDISEQKITLPLLCAFANAGEDVVAKVKDDMRQGKVDEVLAFAKEFGGLEYARKSFTRETETAILSLSPIPDSKAKALLIDLARNLLSRNR